MFRAGLGQARILACDTEKCPGCSTDLSVPRVFTENNSDLIYPAPFEKDFNIIYFKFANFISTFSHDWLCRSI